METVELANKYFRFKHSKKKNINSSNNKYPVLDGLSNRIQNDSSNDLNRVVGIELSGNPKLGDFKTFLPALNKARTYGIPISVHTGEVKKPMEVTDILNFKP